MPPDRYRLELNICTETFPPDGLDLDTLKPGYQRPALHEDRLDILSRQGRLMVCLAPPRLGHPHGVGLCSRDTDDIEQAARDLLQHCRRVQQHCDQLVTLARLGPDFRVQSECVHTLHLLELLFGVAYRKEALHSTQPENHPFPFQAVSHFPW